MVVWCLLLGRVRQRMQVERQATDPMDIGGRQWGRGDIWDQSGLELGELARLQTLMRVPRNMATAPKLP